MPLDMFTIRPARLRLSKGVSVCASFQRRERVRFERGSDGAQFHFETRRLIFGNDPGVIDERVEVTKRVVEKSRNRRRSQNSSRRAAEIAP